MSNKKAIDCASEQVKFEQRKTYIGDGVYICHDGYHFVLTTGNGVHETNRICLDPEVTAKLVERIEAFTRAVDALHAANKACAHADDLTDSEGDGVLYCNACGAYVETRR